MKPGTLWGALSTQKSTIQIQSIIIIIANANAAMGIIEMSMFYTVYGRNKTSCWLYSYVQLRGRVSKQCILVEDFY